MNTHEYRRKHHPEFYNRSWPLTISSLALALIVVWGMILAWRHLEHDIFLILAIMLPAGFVVFILGSAALNGSKRAIREAIGGILELVFFWWP